MLRNNAQQTRWQCGMPTARMLHMKAVLERHAAPAWLLSPGDRMLVTYHMQECFGLHNCSNLLYQLLRYLAGTVTLQPQTTRRRTGQEAVMNVLQKL